MSPSRTLDRRRIRRAFNDAAASYDEAAVLHRKIADELFERLSIIRCRPRRILDAGCGTGYAIGPLVQRYRCPVIALDLALPMLARARRREGIARAVAGDVERLPLAGESVGLLFSNLVLQWCDPAAAFAEFRRVLSPGGLLMFSTFGPDTLQELRAGWQEVDSGAHVHRFIDMHDLGDLLLHCGFETPVVDMEHYTLTYADLPDLVGDLRALGAGNAATNRPRGLTGRHRGAALTRACERFRDAQGRLPATYEVIYGHAFAPSASGAARVQFDPAGRM